ncbi:hypothetical protein BRCON_1050 [Candidatus Sumerlaea chitinivorans]|uniref:Uncharacterized protein n=1 Tax=Sumerlaea chitinivorans TaxID=2250252 RepID=A0A2Z4Y3P2_SUMC1|nr:hypothetical protein BRCON_1050 [Candidatus Sumerlaea chitinivorans]
MHELTERAGSADYFEEFRARCCPSFQYDRAWGNAKVFGK